MTEKSELHERLIRDERADAKGSSDRAFGLVMAAFFAIVGVWPLTGGTPPRWWSWVLAGTFLAFSLIAPRNLAPLNRAWTAFGLLLHKVTNPIFLGVIFFGAMVPTGLLLRAFRKDLLRIKIDKSAVSYWIRREPSSPAPETMNRQF